jgi:glycosyltransferase involved in cell wall biosynthesis
VVSCPETQSESTHRLKRGIINHKKEKIRSEPERVLYADGRALAPSREYSQSQIRNALARLKVSIVLPCYNHGSFLRSAIQSVFSSPLVPTELIVVNDGSTDDTKEVLRFFENDPRIRIVHQENRGLPEALNRGFSLTTGDFVAWTSADNLFLEGSLDRLSAFLMLNPSVDLVYADVELIDEDSKPFLESNYRTGEQSSRSSELNLPLSASSLSFFSDNFLNACVLFRRQLLQATGPHKSEFLGFEDYDFWLRCSQVGALAHIDERKTLYQYRLHRNSLTAQLDMGALAEKQEEMVGRSRRVKLAMSRGLNIEFISPTSGTIDSRALNDVLSHAGHRIIESPKPDSLIANGDYGTLRACDLPNDSRDVMIGDALGSEIVFSCSEHQKLHGKQLCKSGIIHARISGEFAEIPSFWPSYVVLPSIAVPNILRRARDTNFNAIEGGPTSLANFVIFVPDNETHSETWLKSYCQAIIEHTPQATFALHCNNPAQRALADRVNLSLPNVSNLRIIDCSKQDEAQKEKSLLFVLSSSDGIISLDSGRSPIAGMLDLRVEAALAAIAGIRIIRLRLEDECLDNQVPLTATEVESALRTEVAQIPHLETYTLKDFLNADQSLLKPQTAPVQYCTLDQYLETCSAAASARRMASLLFCRG